MPEINRILVANRGEIACRIMRTARQLGYRTVAVYSEADAEARHVSMADAAVPIGKAPAAESYLNIERLIDAARLSGANAVHPGYGFLSENADFARACAAAGLTFIGPAPDAIELMGSKRLSKLAMIAAGVPCVPGYQDADQSDARLGDEAARIGYPLMVKASAGGGGRGMRLVKTAANLMESIRAARSEALSAFGSDELILERAVIEPRHIEIQVFADQHGNVVHLGERDCSVQRRHQKVIEEAPSPFVTPKLRAAMGKAAVDAARACNYTGAGTIEFLVDADGHFYFLEMNTRLQVEHPVTELVTGLDLVEWQLRVAAGEELPLKQDDICRDGWAMEARLYAEDPKSGSLPQTGKVMRWAAPTVPGIRVDHGLMTGQKIGAHYDPLLAKIVAHGRTRNEARRLLASSVEDCTLLGVVNNKAFLAAILRHEVFADGGATTAFLATEFADDPTVQASPPSLAQLALAAALFYLESGQSGGHGGGASGWRNTLNTPLTISLLSGGETYNLRLTSEAAGAGWRFGARCDGEEASVEISGDVAQRTYIAGGVLRKLRHVISNDTLWMDDADGCLTFRDVTFQPPEKTLAGGTGRIAAPMDGSIASVLVAIGDRVERGQTLAVLEAMKMEHPLTADADGVIAELAIAPGDQVRTRQSLIVVKIDDAAGQS